jgi:hypothetical protein
LLLFPQKSVHKCPNTTIHFDRFQVADMYNNQEQVKNQKEGGGKAGAADDDFDF